MSDSINRPAAQGSDSEVRLPIEWESWAEASAVTLAERNEWAQRIAAGEALSIQSGDSIVFGDFDDETGRIDITDAQTRRTASVPAPADHVSARALVLLLKDALADGVRSHAPCDPEGCWCVAARAALAKAEGRSDPKGPSAIPSPAPPETP